MADTDDAALKPLKLQIADLETRLANFESAQERSWTKKRAELIQEYEAKLDALKEELTERKHASKKESGFFDDAADFLGLGDDGDDADADSSGD